MSAVFQVMRLLIMTATLWLAVSANQPKNYDCMSNPFLSGCRGISAKRSAADGVARPTSGRAEMLTPRFWSEPELKSCSKVAARLWRTALIGQSLAENPLEDYSPEPVGSARFRNGRSE